MDNCGSGFVNLLTSIPQNPSPLIYHFDDKEPVFSSQFPDDRSLDEEKPKERRERRKWSPTEDLVLISAWLNTSKDALVGNEQKSNAFCSHIANYYGGSPKLAGVERREPAHCKARWQKINDHVCKFVGSYEAAAKQKSSGQNDDDVMKLAYEIFTNDYKKKFTLEYAWRELRHDQKWCGGTSSAQSSKRRKTDEQSGQSAYVDVEVDQPRPPGVKAAKGKAKKTVTKSTTVQEEGKDLAEFKSMWEIREKDFVCKAQHSKNKMLEKKQSHFRNWNWL